LQFEFKEANAMKDSKEAIVSRYFDEVCNRRKLAGAEEIFTAGHIYHDPNSRWVGTGPRGMRELTGAYQSAFPDAHWQVEELLTSGDTVVARWTGTGTHQGDLAGLAPTGKSVEVAGIWMFRISGGKIAESWNCWDFYGMMAQIGAVPAVGQPAAGAAR